MQNNAIIKEMSIRLRSTSMNTNLIFLSILYKMNNIIKNSANINEID
jgi:hypothetical protein